MKSAFRACCDGQACTFPTALSDESEVSEIDGWGICHHLNSSDFSDDKQCGFYNYFQEKKNTERKSTEKLSCWKSIPWKYDRYTEMWQEADLPKLFRQTAPCLFSSAIPKVGIGYADSEVCEDRGHNLFLPKMRRISARQLNHRNGSRKVCPTRKK